MDLMHAILKACICRFNLLDIIRVSASSKELKHSCSMLLEEDRHLAAKLLKQAAQDDASINLQHS